MFRIIPIGLVMVALSFLIGCSGSSKKSGEAKKKQDGHDHEEHAHEGKHGGALIEVGAHVAHVEFVHHPKEGEVTLYLTGKDAKTELSIADTPSLKLSTDQGPKVISTEPVGAKSGKASQFTAKDDVLKSDPIKGRISLKIDGKPYNPEIEEAHNHEGHDHEKGHGNHEGHDHDKDHKEDHDDHKGHDHDKGHMDNHDDHEGHDHD